MEVEVMACCGERSEDRRRCLRVLEKIEGKEKRVRRVERRRKLARLLRIGGGGDQQQKT